MSVIIKYIVVRNGVEKMTFATKKEADAHDKMLDIADNLYEFIGKQNIGLDEKQMEDLSLIFAENKDEIMPILRGITPKTSNTTPKKAVASKKIITSKKTASKKTGHSTEKGSPKAASSV